METHISRVTHPSKTLIDEAGNIVRVQYRGGLTTAEVILADTNIKARGHARLNEGDVYNKQFGELLSINRASQRALRKFEKRLASKGVL